MFFKSDSYKSEKPREQFTGFFCAVLLYRIYQQLSFRKEGWPAGILSWLQVWYI